MGFWVRTDINKLFLQTFQDLQRPIPGFSRTQKSFLYDFLGHTPFTNMGCMRSKKCIYKISYQCICITVKKWKCNIWGCRFYVQYTVLATTQTRTKNSRNAGL